MVISSARILKHYNKQQKAQDCFKKARNDFETIDIDVIGILTIKVLYFHAI